MGERSEANAAAAPHFPWPAFLIWFPGVELDELAELLRQDAARLGDAAKSPHFRPFYECAMRQAAFTLRSFERQLGQDRLVDLAHDVLLRWRRIIAADSPRAYLIVCLLNQARSWMRRQDAPVVEDPPEVPPPDPDTGAEENRRIAALDFRRRRDLLTPREQTIVSAELAGQTRAEIAEALGTTRANVDQILNRMRRRLGGTNT